jgi:hypothetical protein
VIPVFPPYIQDGLLEREREAIMEYTNENRSLQKRIGMMIWPTDPRARVNVLVEFEEVGYVSPGCQLARQRIQIS